MIEAEGSVGAERPVIAEQSTGGIANYRIRAGAGSGAGRRVEQRVVLPQPRARARDCQAFAGDFVTTAIAKDDVGGAVRPPWPRGGIDQLAHRVAAALAEPKEQSRRQPG